MNPEQTALRLIPALYDAAVHAERTEEALAAMAGALGGYAVGLALQLPGAGRASRIYSVEMDPGMAPAWAGHFHTVDPALAQIEDARVGELVPLESLMPARWVLRSEFYADFMRPFGFSWGPNYSAVLARQGGHPAATLVVVRRQGAKQLGAAGRALVELLTPHLIAMRSTWATLQVASSGEARLADTFDLLPLAVFIVDARRQVLWASRAARELVEDRDGLRIERGVLRAQESATSRRLERSVGEAAGTGNGTGLSAGGTLLVPRASGRRALEVRVTPLPRETTLRAFELPGVVAVFATDPEAAAPDAAEVLAALYALTPAEAALATLLSRDLSLSDAAERLGITRETARQRLKVVFGKTATQRQASLVRLLVRGPASLRVRSDPQG